MKSKKCPYCGKMGCGKSKAQHGKMKMWYDGFEEDDDMDDEMH